MGHSPRMLVVLLFSSLLSLCAGSSCVAEVDEGGLMPWHTGPKWFRIWNSRSYKELVPNADNTVSMGEYTGKGHWTWAANSCNPDLKYLVSHDSGLLLAADGKTLTEELEGNAWLLTAGREPWE